MNFFCMIPVWFLGNHIWSLYDYQEFIHIIYDLVWLLRIIYDLVRNQRKLYDRWPGFCSMVTEVPKKMVLFKVRKFGYNPWLPVACTWFPGRTVMTPFKSIEMLIMYSADSSWAESSMTHDLMLPLHSSPCTVSLTTKLRSTDVI